MKTNPVTDVTATAGTGVFEAVNRRSLLTGAGVVAAAASGLALVEPALAFNASAAENAPRYQVSEHVKTFYRVAGR